MQLRSLLARQKKSIGWRIGSLVSLLAGLMFLVGVVLSSPAFASESMERIGSVAATQNIKPSNSATADEKDQPLSASIENSATSEKAKLSESDIPLNLDKNLKSAESGSSTMRVVFSFIVISIMAGAAFFLVKKQAYKHKNNKYQPQIKILTQHFLGPKKSLAVIRVAGESILVGITDHNISMIKALSLLDEELPTDVPTQFSNLVKSEGEHREDDAAITDIKESVVSKLKEMRSFQ